MKHLPLLVLLLLVGGCSMLPLDRPPERNAAVRLDQGLASLDAGLYAEAFEDLAWVYSACAGYEASHRALAGLAALELDPRNPAGREAVGGELLGRLVQHPGPPTWVRPLAETSYLLALALGAPGPAAADADTAAGVAAGSARVAGEAVAASDSGAAAPDSAAVRRAAARPAPPMPVESAEPAYGCGERVDSDDWVSPRLPGLPGPSLVALLAESETAREGLTARADSLSRVLAVTQQQLQETRAELERIRKTLKP